MEALSRRFDHQVRGGVAVKLQLPGGHLSEALALEGEPVSAVDEALKDGVGLIVAVIMAAEVGDFARFANPRQLMAYLGLVPSEHYRGASVRRGGITKAGNTLARRALIEGAWTYRMPARVSRKLLDRNETVPAPVRDIAWKAQQLVGGIAGWSPRASRRSRRRGPDDLRQEPRPAAGRDNAARFLAEVLADAKIKRLVSTEHFSVDGTLIEAWASMKGFRPRDGSDAVVSSPDYLHGR